MTCFGFGLAISSKMWCPTWVGSFSGAPQWLQVHLRSGDLVTSISLGFGRVVPLCPLGLPGKRLEFFVWSPFRVGYMRLEGGVCGFSWSMSLRLRLSISFFRARFSSVSSLILLQVWQVNVLGALLYGSRRTTLTRFPIQSLGTMILALFEHCLATFSTIS